MFTMESTDAGDGPDQRVKNLHNDWIIHSRWLVDDARDKHRGAGTNEELLAEPMTRRIIRLDKSMEPR